MNHSVFYVSCCLFAVAALTGCTMIDTEQDAYLERKKSCEQQDFKTYRAYMNCFKKARVGSPFKDSNPGLDKMLGRYEDELAEKVDSRKLSWGDAEMKRMEYGNKVNDQIDRNHPSSNRAAPMRCTSYQFGTIRTFNCN